MTTTTTTTAAAGAGEAVERIQPQPYPLQGQALPTGWGQYPQGAYYPPPVQKPQEIYEEVRAPQMATTTTTQINVVETVPVATSSQQVYTTVPMTSSLGGGMIGPNTYGVPENYPLIPADAACHKCHGTGYKKTMITRHWKACKKCSHKYGTDVSRLDLKHLPPYHSGTTGTYMSGGSQMIGTTSSGAALAQPMNYTTGVTTTTMPAQTYSSTAAMLPAGFQTLPANPQCLKCSGTGYKRSKK
jgi:hypothetical protein